MGSIANIDPHKIFFLVIPNMLGFVRETGSPFTSFSRDSFFEGQQIKNGQKSVRGSSANIDQDKTFFPMVHKTIGFLKETTSPFIPWSRDTFFGVQ